MERAYSTPAAFDRAVKKAVRNSGADAGEGYRQALRDRFLCRVFAHRNEAFVLKGGSGLLARIPDARATRDLDFAANAAVSADGALAEMERIAAIDLGDWCRFVLTKHEESMDVPTSFAAPDFWRERFAGFAKGKLPNDYDSYDSACEIASRFFNGVLEPADEDTSWSPKAIAWGENGR